MMEKRKKLQAKIVSASNDKFVIRIGDISKTPKVGDSLVVTIPSRAKVEMVRKTNSLSGVRITDTIARGKVIGVNEGVVTVKPMVSRTNVAKLQSLASTNTMVGVNAIQKNMRCKLLAAYFAWQMNIRSTLFWIGRSGRPMC